MSFPVPPAGLPSSSCVLDHFARFEHVSPDLAFASDCLSHFRTFLLGSLSRRQVGRIMARCAFPF